MEEHHVAIPFLREGVIFLVASGLIVPIFHHYRISSVLGYLIVGWIIGPFGLGLWVETIPWLEYVVITNVEGISQLAELGVIFLLFVIGLELSLERLWAMRRLVFGLGASQVLITATVITVIASLWGNPPTVCHHSWRLSCPVFDGHCHAIAYGAQAPRHTPWPLELCHFVVPRFGRGTDPLHAGRFR